MEPQPLRLTTEMILAEAAEFDQAADWLEVLVGDAIRRGALADAKQLAGEAHLMRAEAAVLRRWAATGGPAPEPPRLAEPEA